MLQEIVDLVPPRPKLKRHDSLGPHIDSFRVCFRSATLTFLFPSGQTEGQHAEKDKRFNKRWRRTCRTSTAAPLQKDLIDEVHLIAARQGALKLAGDENEEVRSAAVRVIAKLAPTGDVGAIEILLQLMLKDESEGVVFLYACSDAASSQTLPRHIKRVPWIIWREIEGSEFLKAPHFSAQTSLWKPHELSKRSWISVALQEDGEKNLNCLGSTPR